MNSPQIPFSGRQNSSPEVGDGSSSGLVSAGTGPESAAESAPESVAEGNERLSYKFQRLREKLRQSITTGEFTGRLPGERKLARKFRVNAKTLSKALTDLAAEGLLDRSIGRGTFVKGTSVPAAAPAAERWLIICDAPQADSPVIQRLLAINPDAQVVVGPPPQRPSFLNSFKAVVIFSADVTDALVRDLVVRNIPVVVAGRQPSTYSTHAVLIDRSHGAAIIARDLMLVGHRHLAVVEERGSELAAAIRQTASRYAPDAVVEPVFIGDVPAALQQGATAFICDGSHSAGIVRQTLDQLGVEVPRHVSLAAIGSGDGQCRCTGYYVSADQFSQAIVEIIRDNAAKRPVTLFLSGQSIDCATAGPTESMIDPSGRMRYTSVPA